MSLLPASWPLLPSARFAFSVGSFLGKGHREEKRSSEKPGGKGARVLALFLPDFVMLQPDPGEASLFRGHALSGWDSSLGIGPCELPPTQLSTKNQPPNSQMWTVVQVPASTGRALHT